jgi:ribosomal protein S18 acetylase RimI-like enzyme
VSDTTIRRARREDAGAILELWRVSESTPSATDTLADLERVAGDERACCLVAEVDGRVVGSVIAGFDGWRGNIYRLAVHPDHRRKGLARELLTAAHDTFADWGVVRVTALVEKQKPWAMGFWRAVGYDEDLRITRFVHTLPQRRSAPK